MAIALVNKGSGQRTVYDSAEPTDMLSLLKDIRISEPEDFRNFYFLFLL